jgi:hypothetical protein
VVYYHATLRIFREVSSMEPDEVTKAKTPPETQPAQRRPYYGLVTAKEMMFAKQSEDEVNQTFRCAMQFMPKRQEGPLHS